MLRKLFLALAAPMYFFAVNAQDTTKAVSFSGSIDAYYRYNFADKLNNFTSFTNSQSSFELGMASIKADATAMSGKVTATVDLGFGRRAEEFSYNDGIGTAKSGFASLSFIKQAYVTYAPSDKLKFTFGKFATHVGYELLDATLNRNYSMSYMFTNGPFFHTGLKADYKVSKTFAFMLGISNYVDQTTTVTAAKNLIGQLSYVSPSEKLKVYLNYSGFAGSDSGLNPSGLKAIHQVDAVVLGTLNSKFNIGYNGTMQSRTPTSGSAGSWIGNAVYLNFDPTDKFGATLRAEYIMDDKTIYFATKNIFANTLSFNFKEGPLTIIPEIRFESAESNIYFKGDGSGSKSTISALLAMVYKF
jgi:hypothetical protein